MSEEQSTNGQASQPKTLDEILHGPLQQVLKIAEEKARKVNNFKQRSQQCFLEEFDKEIEVTFNPMTSQLMARRPNGKKLRRREKAWLDGFVAGCDL